MRRFPRPRGRDYLAFVVAVATLVVAYVLVPEPIVQYTAWLIVFVVWMVWFVSAAVRALPYVDT